MAIETKTKDIGGLFFEVSQLPYFASQRLFMRLLKLASPGLVALASSLGADGGGAAIAALGDMDVSVLASILGGLFDKLDPMDTEDLTKAILETARVRHNGTMVPLVKFMDAIVGGDFWTGLYVQAFALSVHFGNAPFVKSVSDALAKKKKTSPSPESITSEDGKDENSSEQGG